MGGISIYSIMYPCSSISIYSSSNFFQNSIIYASYQHLLVEFKGLNNDSLVSQPCCGNAPSLLWGGELESLSTSFLSNLSFSTVLTLSFSILSSFSTLSFSTLSFSTLSLIYPFQLATSLLIAIINPPQSTL